MQKVNKLWSWLAIAVFMGGCGVSASNPTGNFRITTATLPSAQISAPYAAAVQADGGTAPYSWVVRKGNWPQGIILNSSTGTVAGSPVQKGRFSITLGATDSSTPPKTTTTTLTVTVNSTQVAVTTTSLPSGAENVAYSTTLAAGNGDAPYSWSLASGKLPNGVTLQSSGTLSGTPTQAGTFSFTAEVTDSTNSTATASLSLTIAAPSSPVINSLSPSSGATSGGSVVTISGANFASGASVTFGGVAASSVTVSSSSQIQAVAPSHVAGTVGVLVSENGQNSGSANFTYTASQSASPTITSVSPTSGASGTSVTVTGTNFESADTVSFGSTSATTTFVSATQLTVVVPTLSAGTYGITVTDPDPATATLPNGFTVTAPQQQQPPATPSGNQGLLSACSYIGSGGCSLPSGWTLVMQQDFECNGSHAVPANPGCGTLPSVETTSVNGNTNQPASTFVTSQVHSGSYAFGGEYSGDGAQINLIYGNGNGGGSSSNVGSFNTLYLSWWEYTDPNAQYGNSDYYLFHVGSPTLCGGYLQDVAYDAQPGGGGGAAPSSSTTMLPIANGLTGGSGCQGYYQWGNAGPSGSGNANLPMMAGQWRQVEVLYTPSTGGTPNSNNSPNAVCSSTAQANCGNGTLKLYINGTLEQESLNANLNGTTNMANSFIEIGGVITDFCDAAEVTRAVSFGMCSNAAPSPFNRYFDDIIMIKE